MVRLTVILALLLAGCAYPAPHGVPNLARVEPGVWRGGQPTAQGWAYLRSVGVKWDVKLNTEREGSDAGAAANGIQVMRLPITFTQQTLGAPDRATLSAAVSAIGSDGTFIHCSHGQDRTGLVVGLYRVRREHWTKAAAWAEMSAHGFHPLLRGLCWAWEGEP